MSESYTCIECSVLYDDRDGDLDERMCNDCLNTIHEQKELTGKDITDMIKDIKDMIVELNDEYPVRIDE